MLVDLMYRIAKGCVYFIYNNQVPFSLLWPTLASLFVAIKIFLWFGLFQISLILFSFLSDPLLEAQKKKKTKIELFIRFLNLRRN